MADPELSTKVVTAVISGILTGVVGGLSTGFVFVVTLRLKLRWVIDAINRQSDVIKGLPCVTGYAGGLPSDLGSG